MALWYQCVRSHNIYELVCVRSPSWLVSYMPLASSLLLFVSSSCTVGNNSRARARHSEESTVAAPERWGAASRRGAFGLPLAKQKNETFSIA